MLDVSEHVFNATTFTDDGMKAIEQTRSLADIVRRNVPGADQILVTMTRPGWKRQ